MQKGILTILVVLFSQSLWASEGLKAPKLYQQLGDEWVQVSSPKRVLQQTTNYVERLSVDELITIGQLIWEIVREGQPVLNFESERLGVLPKGVESTQELTNWQRPVTSKYKVVYENWLGFEMVNFEYRLIFTPGGKYQGQGQYLANVAIEPINVDVSWGYQLNAKFEGLDIVNLGDDQNPMAGLELKLTWSVDTMVQKTLHQTNFFVSGNGEWETL